jgi:23S rRNA pseudouridine1911/1915/1917 synthase
MNPPTDIPTPPPPGADSHSDCFVVEEVVFHDRLDKCLGKRYPAVSRGALQRLLEQGCILVNGQPAKPSQKPRRGDQVSVRWPEARPAEAQPEEIPLEVLHEDADLIVVLKPAGLVVHPAAGNEEHTLVNALLHHCAGQLSGIGGVARPGIVHRLDKETSGCLVVAKNDATHVELARQFADREVFKAYHAVVCGQPARAKGEIRAAIARHATHRKRMTVEEDRGREAWTSWRVLERLREAALLEAVIHTGRTHQIRVHFLHLGYPVVGDETYGKRQNLRLIELTGYTAPRVLLHARCLAFTHPATKEALRFEAPWPPDFQAALAALRPA